MAADLQTTSITVLQAALYGLCAVSASGGWASAADAPQWEALGADSYQGDLGEGFNAAKLGISTVVTDRVSGDAYLLGWGHGLLKSSDGGKTFVRVDGGQITGPACGPHTGYSAQISPLGRSIAVFNMFNKPGPSGYSLDGGVTWEHFARATHDRDFELGAIDWASSAVLAVGHESDNGLYFSTNAGKTWTQLDKSGGNKSCRQAKILGLGVLGPQTLLVGYADRIERSDDAGKAWTKVADCGAVGQAVRFKGRIWWLTRPGHGKQGILTSGDEGASWTMLGAEFPAEAGAVWFGPLFGADENTIVVAGMRGFFETTDGCRTWRLAAPLPAGYAMDWLWHSAAYDPIHRVFYAQNRTKALMRYARAAP